MSRRLRARALRILASAFLLTAVTPLSALASDSGTIAATVTGAAPCITVSGSFAFGSLAFSQVGAPIQHQAPWNTVTATNCGAQAEVILAHISAMTGGGVSWTATRTDYACQTGVNLYGLNIWDDADSYNTNMLLDDTDRTFQASHAADVASNLNANIVMPCTGSDGAGTQMSATITLTATF